MWEDKKKKVLPFGILIGDICIAFLPDFDLTKNKPIIAYKLFYRISEGLLILFEIRN